MKNNLGTQPINKLLRNFAIPSIIAMLVSALYNIVDQFFIGKLGLEYKIQPNLYLSGHWNIGTFNEVGIPSYPEKKELWQDYLQGVGIALTYESLFGPIAFSISKNNDHGDFLSQISIGYVLE